jgi:orotate phosphoribosyltransferase
MDADLKKQISKEVHKLCHLTGSFTLRSGRTATEYFDKYQFEAVPSLLKEITKHMVGLIPSDTEILAGLEMGGIPVVTMLSYHSGLPATFVRKKAKEHGTSRLSEGSDVRGKKVLIVEDVVTSGGQISLSTNDMRNLDASIDYALCVIDRQEGGIESLAKNQIKLISLLTKNDILSSLK